MSLSSLLILLRAMMSAQMWFFAEMDLVRLVVSRHKAHSEMRPGNQMIQSTNV